MYIYEHTYIYIYIVLDRVEHALNERGMTFTDLNNWLTVGSCKFGKADSGFKSYFEHDAKLQLHTDKCLCGHEITQQCHLCPEGSTNIDDFIIVGNQCIHRWGYDPAIRGKGDKVKCECCGVAVNKSGITK